MLRPHATLCCCFFARVIGTGHLSAWKDAPRALTLHASLSLNALLAHSRAAASRFSSCGGSKPSISAFAEARRRGILAARHGKLPPHPTQGFKCCSAGARSAPGSRAPPEPPPPPPAAAAAPGCSARSQAGPPNCQRPATRPTRATKPPPRCFRHEFLSFQGLVDLLGGARPRSALPLRRRRPAGQGHGGRAQQLLLTCTCTRAPQSI